VLVPELSGDYHSQNKTRLYKNIERGLRFPILFSCFLIPFFFALGDKIGLLAFSNTLAGEYIKTGCWILLPMSVTMISTSILNSIGFEKQTFLFYFVGASVTLVCVLVLPPVFGGYAYILGLGLSFTATAVCNLLFLRKKCDGVFARSGKLLKRTVLLSLLLIIPCSLYGKWCAYLCAKVFSPTLSLLFTALTLGIFSLLAYLLCGLFRFPTIKGKKRKKAKIL
jgi:O-antigen/teichoic acid export membrane protein